MMRTTFLTAAILAGLSGAALADCIGAHGTTAGDYTPAPVADATDAPVAPVLLPTDDTAAKTDEG